jgi:type I site-specific restriction-modification system R (restriction) subunit
LTMVMLAKALVREKNIFNPKIILVNDRVDLDDQLAAQTDEIAARWQHHHLCLKGKVASRSRRESRNQCGGVIMSLKPKA